MLGTNAAFATGKLSHGYVGEMYARLEIGVAIVFVLSGFFLFRPWVRAAAKGRPMPSVGHYAWRRMRRVIPGYLVTVVVVFVAFWFYSAGPKSGQSLADLLRYVTLAQIYTDNYSIT